MARRVSDNKPYHPKPYGHAITKLGYKQGATKSCRGASTIRNLKIREVFLSLLLFVFTVKNQFIFIIIY